MKNLMVQLWSLIEALDRKTGMDWLPNTDDLEAILEQDKELTTFFSETETEVLGDPAEPVVCLWWSNGQNKVLIGLNNQWLHLWSSDRPFTEASRKVLRKWDKLDFISVISGQDAHDRQFSEELYIYKDGEHKISPPIGAWHKTV